jgi:hypothetical protein
MITQTDAILLLVAGIIGAISPWGPAPTQPWGYSGRVAWVLVGIVGLLHLIHPGV